MDNWQDVVLPDDGRLGDLSLLDGAHVDRSEGVCVMEAVAWLAGEPHSDKPECACPVITAFAQRLNDGLDDGNRQRLREFIPQIVGSKSTKEVEQRRGFLAADYAVRVFAPMALDATKKPDLARRLRECAPIVSAETARTARDLTREVRDAAYAAYAAAAAAAYAAAYAADAAADAAAYGAADAADAADAAAAAVASAASSAAADATLPARLLDARLDLLRGMLAIKESA